MATAIECRKCKQWFYTPEQFKSGEPYDQSLCPNCNAELLSKKQFQQDTSFNPIANTKC